MVGDTARELPNETRPASDIRAPNVQEGGRNLKLSGPIIATILAGILTAAGSVVGTSLQGWNSLQLEREKEQHELVLKMISIGDLKQAKANLQFLAESGLIADPQLAKKILDAKASPVLPRASGTPFSAPPGTPCGCNKSTGVCVGAVDDIGECVPH